VEQVLNAENIRMLLLMVFGFTCYVQLKTSLLKAMDEKIDIKLAAFHAHLKANDFAHLNNTIEALTFMLEKNKFLEREDKEFIDRRLDR